MAGRIRQFHARSRGRGIDGLTPKVEIGVLVENEAMSGAEEEERRIVEERPSAESEWVEPVGANSHSKIRRIRAQR